jgi:hypothetical protein
MLSFVSLSVLQEYIHTIFARIDSFRVFSVYAKILLAYMAKSLMRSAKNRILCTFSIYGKILHTHSPYMLTFFTHILHMYMPKFFMGVLYIRHNSVCTFSIYSKINC